MPAELACIEQRCRARFGITEILYNCPQCGGLLEAVYGKAAQSANELKTLWRAPHLQRPTGSERCLALPRVHSLFGRPFARGDAARGLHAATPLLPGRLAAEYGG